MEQEGNQSRLEKLALVIDDSRSPAYIFEALGEKQFVCPDISGDPKTSRSVIDKALRERKYVVIIMGGDLGLNLGSYPNDGQILSEKIRDGVYGELNKSTPILNSSTVYPNEYANGEFYKKRGICPSLCERCINEIKEDYLS